MNRTDSLLGTCTWHHIRLVSRASADDNQPYLIEFPDPVPTRALDHRYTLDRPAPRTSEGDALDILCVPVIPSEFETADTDGIFAWVRDNQPPVGAHPITLTLHATQIIWAGDRAAILASPDRLDGLLLALVEFCHHERELRKLERTVAEAWTQLELDTPLAIEVTSRDLPRAAEIARQAQRLLEARRKQARLLPRLIRREVYMPSVAQQLGERLRERTRVEERLEVLSAQLEVFERVYDNATQRLHETRLSRQEQTLEWIIILLLAAETLLLLFDFLRNLER